MPDVTVRKMIYSIEEIFHEGGPKPEKSLRRAAALAIIENPFAGRYEPEIQGFMESLKPLGLAWPSVCWTCLAVPIKSKDTVKAQ